MAHQKVMGFAVCQRIGGARKEVRTAQGHAMTSTLMPNSSANTKSLESAGCQEAGKEPATPVGALHKRVSSIHAIAKPHCLICLPGRDACQQT